MHKSNSQSTINRLRNCIASGAVIPYEHGCAPCTWIFCRFQVILSPEGRVVVELVLVPVLVVVVVAVVIVAVKQVPTVPVLAVLLGVMVSSGRVVTPALLVVGSVMPFTSNHASCDLAPSPAPIPRASSRIPPNTSKYHSLVAPTMIETTGDLGHLPAGSIHPLICTGPTLGCSFLFLT